MLPHDIKAQRMAPGVENLKKKDLPRFKRLLRWLRA